jgi:hypothetical protein
MLRLSIGLLTTVAALTLGLGFLRPKWFALFAVSLIGVWCLRMIQKTRTPPSARVWYLGGTSEKPVTCTFSKVADPMDWDVERDLDDPTTPSS